MSDAPIIVVTGVSGSGKSTVGTLLAQRLGWVYAEADDFHSKANIAKMAAGHPLTDADRWPWLEAIGRWADAQSAAGQPGVVSCSALKRSYRDFLLQGRPHVRMVFLHGDPELIARRLATRRGHYMQATMLGSQLADLEKPAPGERVVIVSIDETPAEIVESILQELQLTKR